MNTKTKSSGVTVRPLTEADLDAVVAIDKAIVGRSRRTFMEKRLTAALRAPDRHIQVAAETNGALAGFTLARIQAGEFGRPAPAVELEAIGVDPARQNEGVGQALVAGLEEIMRHKGIKTLQTEASWRDHGMLRFFDANGFRLARRVVVEAPVNQVHRF
jgi:GNAT superfamily N-acetyltransferase